MSKPESTNDGWSIGLSEDSRTKSLGLVARRRSDPRGLDAIRINWRSDGNGKEIAARLRELANAIEYEAADMEDHTYDYRKRHGEL